MIPDLRFCVVVPGSSIRGAVARRAVIGIPSITVTAVSVFASSILLRALFRLSELTYSRMPGHRTSKTQPEAGRLVGS